MSNLLTEQEIKDFENIETNLRGFHFTDVIILKSVLLYRSKKLTSGLLGLLMFHLRVNYDYHDLNNLPSMKILCLDECLDISERIKDLLLASSYIVIKATPNRFCDVR